MAISRARTNLELAAMGFDYTTIQDDDVANQRALFLLKNHDTVTGALGSGVFTSTGTIADTETCTIGTVVYTFVDAFTGARAAQTLTSDATAPSDGDTVTVGNVVYTYKTTLTGAPYEVLIGVSAAVALDNLKFAINASGGTIGVEYGLGTLAHPRVTATTNTNTTQVVESKRPGTDDNSIVTLESSSHLSWGAASLSGGVASVPYQVKVGGTNAITLDNLKAAINATGTGETEYSSGTQAHPLVTATTNTDTAQTVVPRFKAITTSIVTTTTCADNTAWGATEIASGLPGMIAVPASEAQKVAGGQAL